jgi:hypothetical protein
MGRVPELITDPLRPHVGKSFAFLRGSAAVMALTWQHARQRHPGPGLR